MEFIFDCYDTNLTPEKISDVYYDYTDNEWMITFHSVSDMNLFIQEYGCALIIPSTDDYSYPTFKLTNEFES